jgi:hypothetical protein
MPPSAPADAPFNQQATQHLLIEHLLQADLCHHICCIVGAVSVLAPSLGSKPLRTETCPALNHCTIMRQQHRSALFHRSRSSDPGLPQLWTWVRKEKRFPTNPPTLLCLPTMCFLFTPLQAPALFLLLQCSHFPESFIILPRILCLLPLHLILPWSMAIFCHSSWSPNV